MSSSNSPCAACKCLRRKCTQECVYAPFFPPDQPQKFVNVHKVFGASNVAKLLNDLPASQREDAVNSLAYEAKYRLHDPVYGCVGLISVLQHKLKQVQCDLYNAKKELATYIGPTAMFPIVQQGMTHPSNNLSSSAVMPFNMQPIMGFSTGAQQINPQPQMVHEVHQMTSGAVAAAETREQEFFRDYEPQQCDEQPPQPQHQHEIMRFNGGLEVAGVANSATAYNQMVATSMSSSLVLGSYESASYNHLQQQQQQQQAPMHDTLNSDPQELQLQAQMPLHQGQQDSPELAV